ncbi:glycoside hydrolase family protein [Algoriphagus zhangzhouensis]|uniref:Glycosyl hydrolases family 43 n=1 Tax=Algoriphagus zhangzhouensis TaxID=1073327 RepID=A0A1M7Z683_9BACT|nr:glycoside hydrolase family protein [Algoriphagus zhangzhouensis]TDY49035.1 hypothetical protein A8938_0726 [Algoriphagus zhangzhouensis]SHO60332.1 hypothetical protein SAMN04488108_0726 [Algoriphagus zhangzhouensis]
MKNIFFSLLFLVFSLQVLAQDVLRISDRISEIDESNIFKTEGYYNWGGSIIKGDDGKYHLFYSRWPKESKFTGWLLFSEIAHAIADSPSGPWTYVETALEGRGKGNWDAITAHNPKIKKFGDTYYLYYISTNLGEDQNYNSEDLMEIAQTGYSHPDWKILRPNQRTGVAISKSLNGPWQRKDSPLIEPSGPISTLTVNPAITQGRDGEFYLIVKGDKPNETRFIRNQAMAIGEKPDGPFEILPKAVIDDLDTEDMSLWYDETLDHYYAVFHAHGFIGMMSSPDGINWEKASDYVLTPKELTMKDGSILKPDRLERPFVFHEDGKVIVLGLAGKVGDESVVITIPLK